MNCCGFNHVHNHKQFQFWSRDLFEKWDGPEDPDEEIQELAHFQSQPEIDLCLKYSKNGIIDFVEKFAAAENDSQN